MKHNPEIHHRKSIRLKRCDYSQPGAYFITLCTHNRECLFGAIVDGEMVLSEIGAIANDHWLETPGHFNNVMLDEFVVMPNHIHGILVLNDNGVGVQHVEPLLAITNPPSSPFNKGGQEGDYLTNPAKQAKVVDYERRIDALACLCVSARRQVYKLYELTPKEIVIVESSSKK